MFIVTSVLPMVIGYKSDDYVGSENEELLDNLAFIFNDEQDSDKLEYYKGLLQRKSLVNIESGELTTFCESTQTIISNGPMDSAWPMKCHDLHHTGLSPYSTANNPNGLEKWRFYTNYWIEVGPVIDSDGIIYFAGDWGYVYDTTNKIMSVFQ